MIPEVWIAIAVGGLMAGTVLSALSASLRDLSRGTLEEIAVIRNRPRARARVERILEDVNGHATAIAFPRIVCNLVVAVALVWWVTQVRGKAGPSWVEGGAGLLAASLLLWLFGVVTPGAIARHAGEATVYRFSWALRLAYEATRPLRGVARVVDESVKRLAGHGNRDEAEAIQEEILSVVEEASEEGQFDDIEREMIEAVVRFRDKNAGQVMTPRIEIEAMALSNDLGEVTQIIRNIGHSRIPVYEGDLDHIVGVFYVKDLMKWLAGDHAGGSRGGRTFDLRSLLRPALFVPETKPLRELLTELLKKRVHIAIVADEFGGTAGLVTIEDIVEEVFGDIQDEYEEEAEAVPEVQVRLDSRAAEADARTYIEDANNALRALGVEVPRSEQYDTLGGFVTVTMGRIPQPGESFSHDGLKVTVLGAEPTRVTRLRIEAAAPEPTLVEPTEPAVTAKARDGAGT